ncbi:hypothetical protein D9M72_565870 [compost metagenome]
MNLFLIAFESFIGVGGRSKIGIARIARGFWVRKNDLYVITSKIIPVFDALRVAFPHEESRERVIRRGIIRQTLLPIGRDQVALVMQDLNVCHLVEGNNVGFQTFENGTCLLG